MYVLKLSHRNEVIIMSEEGLKLGRGVYLSQGTLTVYMCTCMYKHSVFFFFRR